MKAVILAGGKGSRLMEETTARPKPMVEIGGMPILWHIMKSYASHGIYDFVVCLGYKGYIVKEWFANQQLHRSDIEVDMGTGTIKYLNRACEQWRVTLADTGEESLTGTRLRKILPYLNPGESFCMTYGDGVGNIDIGGEIEAHALAAKNGRLATVAIVQPEGRFGSVNVDGEVATDFVEKPKGDGSWINAGFFVMEPGALEYIPDADCMWEDDPIKNLARDGKLGVWRHESFWRPMDTLRDKERLEALWASGKAPWKVWT